MAFDAIRHLGSAFNSGQQSSGLGTKCVFAKKRNIGARYTPAYRACWHSPIAHINLSGA
jgi:hypothetical protein